MLINNLIQPIFNVSNNCIWQDEKNLTKFWNSKKENTRWRKTCFSYLGSFSSFLHFSIDDDEITGKMNIIQKKRFYDNNRSLRSTFRIDCFFIYSWLLLSTSQF